MKKITRILTLACLLFVGSTQAQVINFTFGTLLDTVTQLPIANENITIIDSGTTGNIQVNNVITDANGNFFDSIWSQGSGTIYAFLLDCNSNLYLRQSAPYASTGSLTSNSWTLTMQICQASTVNCAFSVSATPDTTPLSVNFNTTYPATFLSTLTWDFGDGTTGSGVFTNHVYSQPGTYVYCLAADSCPPVCDTVVVAAAPTFMCQANYMIDTVISGSGTVIIWNASSVSGGSGSTSTTSFMWDFGDGTTSNLTFPTHQYANAGMYQVCLTMSSTDAVTGDTCTSTFCDSLGVDANGNLIYKNAVAGWELKVLDPNSIGIEEDILAGINTYPNPVTDVLTVSIPENISGQANFTLYNMAGAKVKERSSADANLSQKIDVADLPNGLYVLQIEIDGRSKHVKVIKQN